MSGKKPFLPLHFEMLVHATAIAAHSTAVGCEVNNRASLFTLTHSETYTDTQTLPAKHFRWNLHTRLNAAYSHTCLLGLRLQTWY